MVGAARIRTPIMETIHSEAGDKYVVPGSSISKLMSEQ